MTEATKRGLSQRTKAWVMVVAVPLLAMVVDMLTYVPLFYLVAYLLPVRLGRNPDERRRMLIVCALICVTGTATPIFQQDQIFLFQRGTSLAGQLTVFVISYYSFLRQSRTEAEIRKFAHCLTLCRILAKL